MRRANRLLAGILTGLALGVVAGWLVGPRAAALLPPGTFFLDALKMTVIPLIVTSMIAGVAALGDVRGAGVEGATA